MSALHLRPSAPEESERASAVREAGGRARPLRCEDGGPVRPSVCDDCPFVGFDRTADGPRELREWFTAKPEGAEPRAYCHSEGSPYHPADPDDRGCRGFYAAARRMGLA